MKKNLMRSYWQRSRLLIINGSLFSVAHATDLPLDSVYNFSEKIGDNPKKRNFANDFFNGNNLSEGTSVHVGKEIGRGAFGAVHAGSVNGQEVIVKRPIKETDRQDMDQEYANSNLLSDDVANQLRKNNPEYGRLLGMGNVVPVIGQAKNGSIVQKRIRGANLEKAAQNNLPPFTRKGYPENLQEAIKRAVGFYLSLVTLHDLKWIHCDVKPQNAMISNDPGNPCFLIDLGLLKREGNEMAGREYSPNGGPEYTNQEPVFFDYQLKLGRIQKNMEDDENMKEGLMEELKAMPAESDDYKEYEELISQLKERLKNEEDEITEIKDILSSFSLPKAHPSYDIYSSAPVLLTILFGKEGNTLANWLYFNPTKEKPSPYVLEAQKPEFSGSKYFQETFEELNEDMKTAGIQNYPQPTLDRLASLLARISSLDPNERPSAIEIVEELQGLALAPYWTKSEYPDYISNREDFFLNIKW